MSANLQNVPERAIGARTFHVKPHDVRLTDSVALDPSIPSVPPGLATDLATPYRMPPDLAILKANFAMPMNGVLTSWDAGVTVTDAPSIAYLLEHDAPATYYIEVKNG